MDKQYIANKFEVKGQITGHDEFGTFIAEAIFKYVVEDRNRMPINTPYLDEVVLVGDKTYIERTNQS